MCVSECVRICVCVCMHCVFMCVHVFVSVPCNLRLPSNLIVSFLSFKEFESEFRTDGVGEGVVSLGSR